MLRIRLMRIGCFVVGCVLALGVWVSPGEVRAGTSTVFGGSLLEEGEVAVSAGIGFPDAFVQFDFANSRTINLALRARINYNLGFPFFGLYGFISAPIRIGLIKPAASKFVRGKAPPSPDASPLTLSLQFEPGLQVFGFGSGLTGGLPHSFLFGATLGTSVMMSYRLNLRWHLNFGLDIPLFFTLEPGNSRNVVFGVNMPLELVFGAEFELNENYSLFGRVASGPIIYFGNMAANFTPNNVAASFSARLWLGFSWRR